MFQLKDCRDGLPAHVLDRILIAEPIRPFDRIVHMPLPTVFAEIAKTSCNAALRGYRVTACRKNFCNASCRQAGLDGALSGAQTGTDDDDIKRMVDELV